jgi:hypothetical protein
MKLRCKTDVCCVCDPCIGGVSGKGGPKAGGEPMEPMVHLYVRLPPVDMLGWIVRQQ